MPVVPEGRNPLSLDMGWKLAGLTIEKIQNRCRNPLSLDMGWKLAGLTIEKIQNRCRNPLSLDLGWKRKELYKEFFYDDLSQSAFAGYGLEVLLEHFS